MDANTLLLGLLLLSGVYMAWNIGANDVANALGTSIGSGALTLRHAVIIAALFEFLGALLFGSHVSSTVQKGIVDPELFINNPYALIYGMLASLLAAGAWLQIASFCGWPVSTTHSIVGSLIGFGFVFGGADAVKWENIGFIVTSWITSPLAGGILGYFIFNLLRKKIFYTRYPIAAAKVITPLIVFAFVSLMSLILLLDGLESLPITLTFVEGVATCFFFGSAAAFICFLLLRRLQHDDATHSPPPQYPPEVAHALDKAKRHLGKLEAAATGALRLKAAHLVEEVDALNQTVNKGLEREATRSDFAAVEKIFGYLQIMSASLMAFAHGANDVANAIGPLAAAIDVLKTGVITMESAVPMWILALGGAGIIVGLATWGWRVIETIGKKITELTPSRGFSAEFGAAITIFVATRLGMPISTTHTLVGAVIGVGLARGIGALNLKMTRDIFFSWIVTVPAGAGLAIILTYGIQYCFGA